MVKGPKTKTTTVEPTADAVEPTADATWERIAKNILRAELMRRGLSYSGLVDKLDAVGVLESEANLRNKVSRGRFTAIFFLQCLAALEVDWLRVPTADEMERASGEYGGQALASGGPGPGLTRRLRRPRAPRRPPL